jgi:hypothetical protein
MFFLQPSKAKARLLIENCAAMQGSLVFSVDVSISPYTVVLLQIFSQGFHDASAQYWVLIQHNSASRQTLIHPRQLRVSLLT